LLFRCFGDDLVGSDFDLAGRESFDADFVDGLVGRGAGVGSRFGFGGRLRGDTDR